MGEMALNSGLWVGQNFQNLYSKKVEYIVVFYGFFLVFCVI